MDKRNLDTQCWIWGGRLNSGGYGFFNTPTGKVMAHKYCYELWVDQIPEGLTLDHLCFEPACVNPDHLEPVTMRVNILRSNNPPAINARKTHCPQGHAYAGDNLYMIRTYRYCRACVRQNNRIYKAKRRALA